jgi:hypothetical protein
MKITTSQRVLPKPQAALSKAEISPFVRSMSTGNSIPVDLNYKEEYSNYLIEKYK